MAKDYYRILGLSPQAGGKEIKQAYRRLVMEHHPDRRPDQPDSEDRIRQINEAYQTLGDETTRTRYDAEQGLNRRATEGMSKNDADFMERFATGVYQPPKRKNREQG